MPERDILKLNGILEAISKIENCIQPFKNADDFLNDPIRFDAAMMNFVVIGEMVNKLTQEFREQNRQIDWVKVKDFRNLIAHDYFGIDAEEVWQIANSDLPELKKDIQNLSNS